MSESKRQAPAFDVGTRPHGLSAELQRTHQESGCPVDLDSLEDGFDFDSPRPERGTSEAADRMPEVYRTPKVRSCCRSIRAAADGLRKFHYLEMTDCEFLHVMAAIEHDRNRMRKAIRKGLAVEDDMKGTDSLWQKIQEIRALRMRYAGGVK